MIALSLSIFLLSLGVFLASLVHGPGLLLEAWLFRGEFSALFAGHIVVVLLASRATSARRRSGQRLWRFYRDQPHWAGIVQVVLLLAAVTLAFLGREGRVQQDLSSGGVAHCVQTREGRTVSLAGADCESLRLSGLRTLTAFWSALSFFAFTQLALSPRTGSSKSLPSS